MNVTVLDHNVSQEEAVRILGLQDYAEVKQLWVDNVAATMDLPEERIREMFVWCYDGGSIVGYPYPLTVQAYGYLKALDMKVGLHNAEESVHSFNVLLTSA